MLALGFRVGIFQGDQLRLRFSNNRLGLVRRRA
jgi:hypothetical protein